MFVIKTSMERKKLCCGANEFIPAYVCSTYKEGDGGMLGFA